MKLTTAQISDIATALDDSHYDHHWYWDRQEKEMHIVSDMLGGDYEEMGLEEDPVENPERYLEIEGIESRRSFCVMESYAESLPEGECRRALIRALNGCKPFAHFRNTLGDFPEEREAWFERQNQWITQKAHEFIQENKLGEV